MAEALQLDTDREDLLEELDWTTPLSLELCLGEDLELHMPLIRRLPPLERDVLILVHYSRLQVQTVALILRTTPAKVSACLRSAELGLADMLLGAHGPWPLYPERVVILDVVPCPGLEGQLC